MPPTRKLSKKSLAMHLNAYGRLDVFFRKRRHCRRAKIIHQRVDADSFNNVFRVNTLGFVILRPSPVAAGSITEADLD